MLPQSSLRAIGVLLFASIAHADAPLHERIDQAIEKHPAFSKSMPTLADDAEFLRRIYLDLTGIIPSAVATRAFLADAAPDRRARVIDRLLDSPGYARHMKSVFDVLLMDRRPGKHVKQPEWDAFLQDAFATNQPYDALVSEILAADGADPKKRAAARFYLDRDGEPHQVTKDISRVFLGMNLNCAQCHHHPIVQAYRQEFYYGIFAFVNRSFVFTEPKTKLAVFAEKGEGAVTFSSVFEPKVTMETGPRLPDGKPIDEPKLAKGKEYKVAPAKDKRPIPIFSRREHLPGQLTASDRFARTAANRLWAMMLGRGLIHPVDYDHEANPPSHRELMDMLAAEFRDMKYNVKSYLREIALSRTYQRSSRLVDKDAPADAFAVAAVRPLSPEQLAWSIMQATGALDVERAAAGAKASEQVVFARLAKYETIFVKLFGSEPGQPADESFLATLDQTLFLNNADLLRGWLAPRTGNLADRLARLTDPKDIADEAFLSILNRLPGDDERRDVVEFIAARPDKAVALQDLCWALLATAEFRFNH